MIFALTIKDKTFYLKKKGEPFFQLIWSGQLLWQNLRMWKKNTVLEKNVLGYLHDINL